MLNLLSMNELGSASSMHAAHSRAHANCWFWAVKVSTRCQNTLPSTKTRCDGRLQDAIISDLEQQVEDLEDLQDRKPVRATFLTMDEYTT